MTAHHELFVTYFNWLSNQIHAVAREKGFWDRERNVPEMLMLVVTEIAEAVEGLRHGNPPDDKIPAFSAMEAEIADAVIRIMDLAPGLNLRLAEAIVAKLEFNRTRPRLHGKAF
jgi:NTP pyrophosphatase (non-canonical NTP hydrolase)